MGVTRQLGRISGALFLVALGGMAPFSVDDRAEKGGSLIRAFGRSHRGGLQKRFILLQRDCDWDVCGCFYSPELSCFL